MKEYQTGYTQQLTNHVKISIKDIVSKITIHRSDFENGKAGILGVVIETLKEFEITS